jgi:hypothetical protein
MAVKAAAGASPLMRLAVTLGTTTRFRAGDWAFFTRAELLEATDMSAKHI